MPKFNHDDRVVVTAGEYQGKVGVVFGSPAKLAEFSDDAPEGEYFYQVNLGTDDPVIVSESEMERLR